jgi:hypothetical protein
MKRTPICIAFAILGKSRHSQTNKARSLPDNFGLLGAMSAIDAVDGSPPTRQPAGVGRMEESRPQHQ